MNSLIFIVSLMVVAWILGLMHDRTPRVYRERKCTGREWKRAFPDADASEIRKFLYALTEAFAFNRKNGLKFSPTDTFTEIYIKVYKHPWMVADELEDVEFILTLEEEFGKEIADDLVDEDPTLGELFDFLRKNANHKASRTSYLGPII
jgi:hypothetical protein